jgi:hypothetical protein
MRTFAGFSHYAVSPPWRRPSAGRWRRPPADGAGPRRSLGRRCAASSVPCAAKMRYPVEALRRDCRGPSGPGSSQGPATGDWLSGRAPRSHRGGHWFDPSIAHRCKSRSEAPRTALIRPKGWELLPYWEEFGRSCSPTGPGAGQADARGADGECGQAGMTARRITAW